jgi:glucosamine--fructose-6-phosphate aminotransferase (isomerizing)
MMTPPDIKLMSLSATVYQLQIIGGYTLTMSLMLAEIEQQPEVIERTINREGPKIAAFGARLKARPPRLIVLVARGSSDNACLFGRYLLEMSTGIPVSLAAPPVCTLYKSKLDLRDTLVIGVSQSGEGVDINMVLTSAKRRGRRPLQLPMRRSRP